MNPRDPQTKLPTHDVDNQPPPLPPANGLLTDVALQEAVAREAPAWVAGWAAELGELTGSESVREQGFLANRYPPVLYSHDPQGRRIDEVEYHPAYHALMRLGIEHGAHSIAWKRPGDGGAVAHVAAIYLLTQPEQGFCCPITMTHAVIPALRHQPELAREWEPRILASSYDERPIPVQEKSGVTFGMAMTEKQGGSDVRSNTTVAVALGRGGPGGEYALTGHKWFCSAPMSDAFLALAQAEGGISCFLIPRWRPDGTRNPFYIQRLKDKLGNRSNASSEVELDGSWARMVGEEGRGVSTILEMVHQTRLDAATAPAGMMRYALVNVLHHAHHRRAFGARLIDQPLMRNLLADLSLECEAATAMAFRVARAFDEGHDREEARLFARLATAATKFWINKRAPEFLYEAMECLGGAGYVEESVLPRLYREAPVNSIWEGSGNVIGLDVLRAMEREPRTVEVFVDELQLAAGADPRLDAAIDGLKRELSDTADLEIRARRITGLMARTLQASLFCRHAPAGVAGAYCATRLADEGGRVYGTLPPRTDVDALLGRAEPRVA